jgi:hypothetical protein
VSRLPNWVFGEGGTQVTLILPPNWCLFFFRDPRAEFTTARLKECLLADGLSVSGDDEILRVRWKEDGPVLFVSIHRGPVAETIARSVVSTRRKQRKLIPGCDCYVRITINDLEAVLDEINTLIEVQGAIQRATRGLGYYSWNQEMWEPDD